MMVVTFPDPPAPEPSTDLCTKEQVKIESLGRITDNSLDAEIEYKIKDITEKLLSQDPSLTIADRDARLCCIYGVLAWLSLHDKIADNKKIVSVRDGDTTVNYQNNSDQSGENADCKLYKSLKLKLIPFTSIVAKL